MILNNNEHYNKSAQSYYPNSRPFVVTESITQAYTHVQTLNVSIYAKTGYMIFTFVLLPFRLLAYFFYFWLPEYFFNTFLGLAYNGLLFFFITFLGVPLGLLQQFILMFPKAYNWYITKYPNDWQTKQRVEKFCQFVETQINALYALADEYTKEYDLTAKGLLNHLYGPLKRDPKKNLRLDVDLSLINTVIYLGTLFFFAYLSYDISLGALLSGWKTPDMQIKINFLVYTIIIYGFYLSFFIVPPILWSSIVAIAEILDCEKFVKSVMIVVYFKYIRYLMIPIGLFLFCEVSAFYITEYDLLPLSYVLSYYEFKNICYQCIAEFFKNFY